MAAARRSLRARFACVRLTAGGAVAPGALLGVCFERHTLSGGKKKTFQVISIIHIVIHYLFELLFKYLKHFYYFSILPPGWIAAGHPAQ